MKSFTKTIAFLILLLFAFHTTNAQTKSKKAPPLKGYVYQTDGNRVPFTYKVSYHTDTAGNYITQYKVFIYGEYKYDVFGTHDKKKNSIKAEVDVAGGGLFAAVAEAQETTYDTPKLDPFGFVGVGSVLGGDQVPPQLAVRFANKTFTFIKIMSVLGYHGGDGADYFVFK